MKTASAQSGLSVIAPSDTKSAKRHNTEAIVLETSGADSTLTNNDRAPYDIFNQQDLASPEESKIWCRWLFNNHDDGFPGFPLREPLPPAGRRLVMACKICRMRRSRCRRGKGTGGCRPCVSLGLECDGRKPLRTDRRFLPEMGSASPGCEEDLFEA